MMLPEHFPYCSGHQLVFSWGLQVNFWNPWNTQNLAETGVCPKQFKTTLGWGVEALEAQLSEAQRRAEEAEAARWVDWSATGLPFSFVFLHFPFLILPNPVCICTRPRLHEWKQVQVACLAPQPQHVEQEPKKSLCFWLVFVLGKRRLGSGCNCVLDNYSAHDALSPPFHQPGEATCFGENLQQNSCSPWPCRRCVLRGELPLKYCESTEL